MEPMPITDSQWLETFNTFAPDQRELLLGIYGEAKSRGATKEQLFPLALVIWRSFETLTPEQIQRAQEVYQRFLALGDEEQRCK